jgi:tRNA-binding EMAP/Myf-like protein
VEERYWGGDEVRFCEIIIHEKSKNSKKLIVVTVSAAACDL